MAPKVLWTPSRTRGQRLDAFREKVAERYNCELDTYEDLHRWSVANAGAFWREVWQQCGADGDPGELCFAAGPDMAAAQFFPEGQLNYAENCLQRTGPDAAILFRPEVGADVILSWDDLHAKVSCAQQALQSHGVGVGDRVAGLMPNIPATVIYMLATASLGAIWSSCSPDFGAGAVLDRISQIEPKVLISVDGYTYKGKPISVEGLVDEVAAQLPSLKTVIRVPFLNGQGVEDAAMNAFDPAPVTFRRVGFNDPLFVMFSSGTSGPPKCILHRVGGVLLQHLKEHQLHCDLRVDDRLFYFSTCSWMMWNWLVSGLASGATIVLFDGAPTHPTSDVLWQMAEDFQINHFGTSAKYIDGLRKSDFRSVGRFDLSNLRIILSTGSPLSERNFEYVYEAIHSDAQLTSISGGTDILSCFLLGSPALPVHSGELQCAGLGMDVVVMGDDYAPLEDGVGELVCQSPFPCQPIGFWNDPDGSRFRSSYFESIPGVWSQKDSVSIRKNGGYVVLGRSDSTLNPGGVRIGTAEIYRALDDVDGIDDAVVVGRQVGDDMAVELYVTMRQGYHVDGAVKQTILTAIKTRCTRRHMPSLIKRVDEIPRTRNGKISESAVREAVNNRKVSNIDQLENPACLASFYPKPTP